MRYSFSIDPRFEKNVDFCPVTDLCLSFGAFIHVYVGFPFSLPPFLQTVGHLGNDPHNTLFPRLIPEPRDSLLPQ